MVSALPLFEILISSSRDILNNSGSFEEFLSNVNSLTSPDFIKSFGDLLFNAITNADSIGRSQIVEKDHHMSAAVGEISGKFIIGKYAVKADGVQWIVGAETGVRVSFDLTPTQALDYFRRKAFWIGGIENQAFIDAVKKELEKSMSDGLTYDEFKDRFTDLFQSYGIVPENTIRLDTIFRTNLFSSYTAGMVKQVEQVKDRFPAWRYVAILDNRTRHSHRNLNGHLFRQGPYPPISFNCRCTPQFLHISQMDGMADHVLDSIYELIDPSEVVDFLSGPSFDSWIADNPVSPAIRSAIESNSV